jgi:hypothetical protein
MPHTHRWERENQQGQCDCSQCHIPDPRGLSCFGCPAYLKPGDADFDTLYNNAPWWWWDSDDPGEENPSSGS